MESEFLQNLDEIDNIFIYFLIEKIPIKKIILLKESCKFFNNIIIQCKKQKAVRDYCSLLKDKISTQAETIEEYDLDTKEVEFLKMNLYYGHKCRRSFINVKSRSFKRGTVFFWQRISNYRFVAHCKKCGCSLS